MRGPLRSRILVLCAPFALAHLLAGAACRNGDATREVPLPPGAWAPTRVAELYFTTEVLGYLEPCGCTTKPLGGIQRLATVLERGKKERLLVDAGNLLLPTTGLDGAAHDQHLLKARVLARTYRQLGALAINLGESDLGGGVELLKELQREGSFPLVSVNVRPVGESGPSVARSFVRTVGDIRIGVAGVEMPERVAGVRGVTAIEYAPALRAEVASLRKDGAELIVVLAHIGEGGARELATSVPGIDVIVRAPGSPIEQDPLPPERVAGALIVEAGSQGQHVGRLTISLGATAPERPIVLDDGGARESRRRQLLERKVRAYNLELEAWRQDPAKAEAVKAKEAQLAEVQAALKAPMPPPEAPSGPSLRVDIVHLTEDVPPDPEVTRILAAYYGELQELNLERGDLAACAKADPAAPSYVGTEKCIECHEDAYEFWKKTKHATAWAALKTRGKHFDLTCIGCHSVGYQRSGGFCRLKDVGALKDVGCEACHGPGSEHIQDEDPMSTVLEAPAETCKASCHVPDHSDAFVYEKYVKQIIGPGHGGGPLDGGSKKGSKKDRPNDTRSSEAGPAVKGS